jgi:hypothetical protein
MNFMSVFVEKNIIKSTQVLSIICNSICLQFSLYRAPLQSLGLLSLPNNVWRLIVFAPFLIIIKSHKQSLGDLLFLLRFLLLFLFLLLLFLFFLSAKNELVHGRSQFLW